MDLVAEGRPRGPAARHVRTIMIPRRIKKYCCEDIALVENYEEAMKSTEVWDCHHKAEILPCGNFSREDLKKFDLYYNRPACELILLSKSDHSKLHSTGYQKENNPHFGHRHTEETKNILRNKRLGMIFPKEWRDNIRKSKKGQIPWNKGKSLSQEYKDKISKTISGTHWYNDGNVQLQARECPPGFVKGRLKKKSGD